MELTPEFTELTPEFTELKQEFTELKQEFTELKQEFMELTQFFYLELGFPATVNLFYFLSQLLERPSKRHK